MQVWDLHISMREFMLDIGIISVLLIIATVLRAHINLFGKYLIPASLIAGFLGLILGPEALGVIKFDTNRLGSYVYHLLAFTFIGVGLRRTGSTTTGAVHIGFIKVATFILQAFIGLLVGLLFLWLISPDLIPAVGMLLPLGFGMGPGIAFSVGQSWSEFGFPEAGNIGLTLAAVGFLIAYFGGATIVNRGVRKGATGIDAHTLSLRPVTNRDAPTGSRLTFFTGAIDTLTFHLALVGAIYILSYVVLIALEKLLVQVGMEKEITVLWSFNFIAANLLAIGTRRLLDSTSARALLDSGTVNRMTSFFADVLVTTAIMAISLRIAASYLGPILLMSLIGGLLTYYVIRWCVRSVFMNHKFERTVGLFAEQTGTISSGLAIIRMTDPRLETEVAQDQVLGSGIAMGLGFPLLILINMPLIRFGGSITGYITVLGLLGVYLALLLGGWFGFTKIRRRKLS